MPGRDRSITLVTDSNSQLTPELTARFDVTVIPMGVSVDGEQFREGVDIDHEGMAAALKRGAVVGSSAPAPGAFLDAFDRAKATGARTVLAIHAGGATSGTANSARVAAGLAQIDVDVVDTGTASFCVSLCLWSAGEVLERGGTAEDAAAAARATAGRLGNVFIVGALGVAAHGGRLAVGTSGLPVLALEDGQMRPVRQVATHEEAVEAMVEYVVQHPAARGKLRLAYTDLAAPELGTTLRDRLAAAPGLTLVDLVRYEVGPSVAAHSGLGTAGCVFTSV